jgi:hypothetical protein
MGIVIGYVYVKTKSIWACMIIHFANNFTTVLEEYLPILTGLEWITIALDLLIMLIGVISLMILIFTKDKEQSIEEKGSFEAHVFDNACDTDCNTCGFVRTIEHAYKSEWSKDSNGHWHECSVCGAKADEAAHIPGAEATETTAQTCTECEYELAPIVVKPAEDGGSTAIIIVACVVGVAAIGGAALVIIKKKR